MRLTFDARTPEQLDRDCKEAFLQTYFQTRGKLHPHDWAISRTHDSGFGKPVKEQERERAPKTAKPPQEVEHVNPADSLSPDEVNQLRVVLARIRQPVASVAAPPHAATLGEKARETAASAGRTEDSRLPQWKKAPTATRRKISPAEANELLQKHGLAWRAMFPDVDIAVEGEQPTAEPTHDGEIGSYQRLGHDLYS